MRATFATVSTRWTWRLPPSDWGKLLFASKGALTVTTATGMWVVPPHQAVWVPALTLHEFETAPGAAMQTLYVRPGSTRRLPNTCRAVRVSPLLRELLRRALQLETLDRRNREQRNLMAILLDELAVLPVAPIDLPMPRDPRALRAARLVRSCLDARHTLAEASRESGEARTLERLFRAETGIAFGIRRQRARMFARFSCWPKARPWRCRTGHCCRVRKHECVVVVFRRSIGVTPGQYFKTADTHR